MKPLQPLWSVKATYATKRGAVGRYSKRWRARDAEDAQSKARRDIETDLRRKYAGKMDMTCTRIKEGKNQ